MISDNLSGNLFEVTHLQLGCSFCFGKLDPEASNREQSAFVQCTACQAVYHADCWQKYGVCAKCGADEAQPLNELSQISSLPVARPIEASVVKPSAIYYDLWWGLYPMPRLLTEKILPWYEDWQPRAVAMLRVWHTATKETVHSQLEGVSLNLLAQNQDSKYGQFIQNHLARLTTVLTILLYGMAYLFLRWLLRFLF